jgi:chemosensory pili system protein ChpA (sensor histidine kinase/response regulator)
MLEADRAPILVVEDNADTREVLERVLEIRGYAVVTARDGLDALAYLQGGGQPAAIILDIAMPHMDGITFSRTIRANADWAEIPIIIYTAMPMKRIPTAAAVYRKGTDDPQLLLDLLARVCQRVH